jgi:hypothetical protein
MTAVGLLLDVVRGITETAAGSLRVTNLLLEL